MSSEPYGEQAPGHIAKIRFDVPHSARIWNYWMGGKDNYEVDRAAGDAWAKVHPEIVNEAIQSREFLIRAVRFLAGEMGIRQFLDIGTGLPTMRNTHEVAQAIAPECRIVYVDNDPLVLAHARALLTNTTPEGVTHYVEADFRNPEMLVSDAYNVLNFDQPIAVMFMGVLGHVANHAEACSIVASVVQAVPIGSYLALYDGVRTNETSDAVDRASAAYAETGAVPYHYRDVEEVMAFFDGLDLLDPGLVPMSQWRPDPAEVGTITPTAHYGGIARKR